MIAVQNVLLRVYYVIEMISAFVEEFVLDPGAMVY